MNSAEGFALQLTLGRMRSEGYGSRPVCVCVCVSAALICDSRN